MLIPELVLQAHFPRGPWDKVDRNYVSGVQFQFEITSFNGYDMMGPHDTYIYTTGMSEGVNSNIELLLASCLTKEEKWSEDELTAPEPIRWPDGFYAVIRGGSFHKFNIRPIAGHKYITQIEYNDSSLTTYTLIDLTTKRNEQWSTYRIFWSDKVKSFGVSEENHIYRPCSDTVCDSIDIQPWSIGPYSVKTTRVSYRPMWKLHYTPGRIDSGKHNINLNYICIHQGAADKTCSKRQEKRYYNKNY